MSPRPHLLIARTLPALFIGAWAGTPAQALTPAEVFAKVSPSVWHVRTYDRDGLRLRQGSAVVVDARTAVTNCHVLYYASRITLSHGKTRVDATLRLWDTERDVCELRSPQLAAPAVALADPKQLAVGQPAYAIGSPLGLELTLSAGLISSLRKDDAGLMTAVQTTAPISPGSSGGGLFDEQARLVGLTTWTVNEKAAQNLNFAAPASFWIDLPERHTAAAKAVAAGKADRMAKALEVPTPSVTFKPAITMPPNPAKWALSLSDRVPYLGNHEQNRFRREFLGLPLPRAFAISDNGASGMAHGLTDPQGDPQQRALAQCQQAAGKPCVVYAIDTEVLYQPPPGAKP